MALKPAGSQGIMWIIMKLSLDSCQKGDDIVMKLGPVELIIVLVIIVLLFGVGRIGKIAGELGSGIRSFREGLKGDDDDEKDKDAKTEDNQPEDTEK
jgi:sec-independent protein translocase protein TatA